MKYTTLVCPGAGAGAETSVYRLQLRLQLRNPAGFNLNSGSGLVMKNTFELQIFRSSKHHKTAYFFKSVHFWIRIVDKKYI